MLGDGVPAAVKDSSQQNQKRNAQGHLTLPRGNDAEPCGLNSEDVEHANGKACMVQRRDAGRDSGTGGPDPGGALSSRVAAVAPFVQMAMVSKSNGSRFVIGLDPAVVVVVALRVRGADPAPEGKDGLTGSSCSNEVPAGGGHSQQLGSLAAQQGGIVLKLGQHGWVHLVVQDSMLVHVHAGRHLRRDRSRHYEFLFVDVNRQQDAGGLQCVDVRRAEIVLIATTLPWTVPKNGKLCI